MKQTTKIKILSVLFLVLTLSIGSQQLRSFAVGTNDASSPATQNNPNNSQESNSESNPLQDANKKFSESLEDFIKELGKVPGNRRKNNVVNFENVLSELQTLETLITTLEFYNQLNKDTNPTIKNIKSHINDIKNILTPFKSGLKQESISQIQETLRKQTNGTFTDNSGRFDKNTFDTFEKYIKEQTEKLNEEIRKLESSSKPETPPTEAPTQESNNYQAYIIVTYLVSIILSLITGLSVGILGTLFLQKPNNKRQKPTNPNHNQPTVPPEKLNNPIPQTDANYLPNPSTPPTGINPQKELTKQIQNPRQTPANPTPPSVHNPDTRRFASSEQRITAEYNHNPKQVCKNAIEVSETEESINQRRLGANHSVILEKVGKGKGSYCIIQEQGFLSLIPKDNLKINQFNYETVTTLFECYNYQPGRSTDFNLKTPAVVVPENQDTWRLQTKGELEFL